MGADNSGSVGANFQGLSGAATKFDQSVQALEDALRNVSTAVDGLQSDWSGAGHMSFQQAITKWHSDVQNMNATLGEISQNVKESNQVYQDVEAAVKKSFAGFGG